jgi:epoxyqueuosine reductase
MPPTYREFIKIPREIELFLNDLLSRDNLHVYRAANLPEKLLAVHSGLSQYGRNNISYVPGMGSFYLLSAYYSDIPCKVDSWTDISTMKTCERCTSCLDACPTNAITEERFLIHAERCITYQNEILTAENFPEWIEPTSHNCIIGCMHCQINCPQNKKFIDNIIEQEEFTEEETNYILEKKVLESLPAQLISKLDRLNLKIYYGVLARNLKVLLE